MSAFTSEQKAVIFAALDIEAQRLVRKIPTIKPHELSTWMYAEAGKAVSQYAHTGANRNLLTFHFGMLVGQHLSAEII